MLLLIELVVILQLQIKLNNSNCYYCVSLSYSAVTHFCLLFRWELVGSVSHCRAGAGVAVCSSHVSQIRDVGQGASNVANCMWPPTQLLPGDWLPGHHQIWSLHKHTTQSTQTVKEGSRPASWLLSHCLNVSLKRIKADVQFAHSDLGILGRFYWLEVHDWQIWSLLWQFDTFETTVLTPAGVICNQWCRILYCIFFCLPCHSYDFFKGKK